MNRRKFTKSFLVGTTTIAAVVSGGVFAFDHHFSDRNQAKRLLTFTNLDDALRELDQLQQAADVAVEGAWSLVQNLTHCEQSIRFSIVGFPENKPKIFQQTIGKLVFNKFENQGFMRHNRNEEIPKAPPLLEAVDLQNAFASLRQTVAAFRSHQGVLQPHFAYGTLSKSEYEKAHSMHLADHFAMMTY